MVAHVELEGLESMEFNKATLEKNGKKDYKISVGGTVQKGDVSVDVTPTVTIGDGGVKPGVEKSELKDDNPANKDNKSVSDIKKDNPNFDGKKLTENIQKNLKNANELASTQGPGKKPSISSSEKKEQQALKEKQVTAEDAKTKAAQSKKEPDNKENK